ncbi:hypothetical protein GCM10009819_15510 [Agromyces tropicus]|uniref:DUF2202 domain-containing protein n=1 Tax=Agromyces tropicus TaxID=555371 RepID=A0ABN2U8W4_9MICO
MRTRITPVVGAVAALLLVGVGSTLTACTSAPDAPAAGPATVATVPAEPDGGNAGAESEDGTATAPEYDTAAALAYLIEEEKLAHDVYVTLGDLWGANVFTNITASETTHQELVRPLLDARGIDDPRSDEVGVFTDPELQALYDELVARGSTSLDEAIQVGIAIEQKDLDDLGAAIAAEDEADVVSVLERLYAGSENHLASFERLA